MTKENKDHIIDKINQELQGKLVYCSPYNTSDSTEKMAQFALKAVKFLLEQDVKNRMTKDLLEKAFTHVKDK